MITASIGGFKRVVRKIRSGKILNKIGSGRIVYFENPLEQIAFKYIPGRPGRLGKYFAKQYGQDEFEIDFDSGSFVQAVMEGKQIRKARYDMYHLIEDVFWSGDVKNPAQPRQWVISG
jgi:hypothetical protein